MNAEIGNQLARRIAKELEGHTTTDGFYALLIVLDKLILWILRLGPPPQVRETFTDLQREVRGHLAAARKLGSSN